MREESPIPFETSRPLANRILVLAAHPDDEVFGPGGTVSLAARSALAVKTWIATDGEGQEGVPAGGEREYAARRRCESARAAEALWLPAPEFGGLPDGELSRRREQLARAIDRLLSEFRPDLVYCPSPVEIHPDHRALAEALYERVASSRAGDADHDRLRFLRVAFYEISHPLLPNTLVDISEAASRKEKALAAYASQQAVRDYAGAIAGLNAYRRLTLSGRGPVEAFRLVTYEEASTRSLEEFRRSIGPSSVGDAGLGTAPAAVVVRTRNRPALLREALESLASQTMRPARVVVVNDGGASVAEVVAPFREAFPVALEELPERRGRSAAANRGVALASGCELVTFLDDDDRCYPDHIDRLLRAHRSGPEAVVYSDAVTVVYRREGEEWREGQRTLQYSLDFDPDYLLLANYIPLHTLLFPAALFSRLKGFDEGLDYSEDWDFLIRLSAETSFRHVRAVTCEYRVFGEGDDPSHVRAGQEEFQSARRTIYERYRPRRTEEGLARTIDRLRAQIAFWYQRDTTAQAELARLSAAEARAAALETERARLLAENEVAHARVAELFQANEEYHRHLSETFVEIERLNSILNQIYASRTWKLHLLLDRLRGR